MRALIAQSDNERRAAFAGVNLFFGVLLGANLGSINSIPIEDYVKLVILLSGSVMALYTIAVSTRPRLIWTLVLVYGALLALTVAVPDLRPVGMEAEMERIIATLAIWLSCLVLVRLTPEAAQPVERQPLDPASDVELGAPPRPGT
jgi:hypothetical protein